MSHGLTHSVNLTGNTDLFSRGTTFSCADGVGFLISDKYEHEQEDHEWYLGQSRNAFNGIMWPAGWRHLRPNQFGKPSGCWDLRGVAALFQAVTNAGFNGLRLNQLQIGSLHAKAPMQFFSPYISTWLPQDLIALKIDWTLLENEHSGLLASENSSDDSLAGFQDFLLRNKEVKYLALNSGFDRVRTFRLLAEHVVLSL